MKISAAAIPWVGLAAALVFSACESSSPRQNLPPNRDTARTLPIESLDQRSLPGHAGEEIRRVATDAAAWQRAWDELRQGSEMLPTNPPAVDFPRKMAILVAMPLQSCVSKISVRTVREEGAELVVDLLEQPPAPNCVCIVAERPFQAVVVERSELPARFEVAVEPRTCGGG